MNELIFASNNKNKLAELNAICPTNFRLISLQEAGINIEIEEPYNTLKENAKEKCRVIYEITKKNCFSEDTGLEIVLLNNEPGVFSARYAGDHKNNIDNINKVLHKLGNSANRNAQFKTIISLCINGEYLFFEGICKGKISNEMVGLGGFGYDSIFIPNGYTTTFAEMDLEQKTKISHRKLAFEKLFIFLSN